MGILYYKFKDLSEDYLTKALEHLLTAEKADSNTAVMFNIAKTYDDLGNVPESEKYYIKILSFNQKISSEMDGDNPDLMSGIKDQNLKVYNNLAMLCKNQGKLESTIRYYKEGLKLDPTNFVFLYNMSLIFIKKGKFRQAVKLLNKAILCKILQIYV